MISIRNSTFIKFDDDISVERMEIDMDNADELPEADYFDGKEICQGSIACDLSTGTFYAMTSDGEWHNQNGEEEN